MKSKICFLSISGLTIIIGLLLLALFRMTLDSIYQPKIPDYNYRLSLIAKENKGKMVPVDILGGGDDWDKVCFFGPYSSSILDTNNSSTWKIDDYTDVLRSDGHNVLIFSKEGKVIDFIIQSRKHGGFVGLSGTCANRGEQIQIK